MSTWKSCFLFPTGTDPANAGFFRLCSLLLTTVTALSYLANLVLVCAFGLAAGWVGAALHLPTLVVLPVVFALSFAYGFNETYTR